jgi:hypothetical protein
MAITSIANLVDAELEGKTFWSAWRKQPAVTTGAGIWFDVSMSPGNPVPNYYAASPKVAAPLSDSVDAGIPHGSLVTPATKYLKTIACQTVTASAVPLTMILCDYLMFYPFVDMSDTTETGIVMTTSIALPRYPTGTGVQIMAVEVASQSGAGNPQFFVTYTNQDGTTGRVSKTVACNTQTVNGTIINTAIATASTTGPFIPLQDGDTGVRKIEKVTFLTADIGLIAFVLVKPIATFPMRTVNSISERNFYQDFSVMPVIKDDAYLNIICLPNGTLASANLLGYIQTVWG